MGFPYTGFPIYWVSNPGPGNRLYRALGRFIAQGQAGVLPASARWILGSAVMFLDKPGREAPRPIRSGEWLRKTVAKTLLRDHRVKIRALMIQLGQYGVALPGGAEALFHARATIEEVAATGALGPLAVVDGDLVNCFGSFEWPAIRDAYAELLPEMLPWEAWCTRAAAEARLPCGDTVAVDRGAGQGEPDGPLKASTTIGVCARGAKADTAAANLGEWVDGWFLDDGQIFCRPHQLDGLLRRLDARLHAAGATRGSRAQGHDIKSTVVIFGTADQRQSSIPHLTEYVRDTCKVLEPHEQRTVLGGLLAGCREQGEAFGRLCAKVEALHEAIDEVGDAATEFVLKSECADVCKATYALRLNGDRIPEDSLAHFETAFRDSIGCTLGGEVGDEPWAQATCATREGGLGARTPLEVSLPAFVASRATARPGAFALFARMEEAGFAGRGALQAAYDSRSAAAFARLQGRTEDDAALRDHLRALVEDSANSAQEWWDAAARGEEEQAPRRDADPLMDEGAEDSGSPRAPALQASLCRSLDALKLRKLEARWVAEERHEDLRRLADLRDPHQDHSWMRSLNPAVGAVVAADKWPTAMRIRLGCAFAPTERLCAACGERVLDRQGYRALCCARGESTKGHYRVRDALVAPFAAADATTACEVPGLVPSAPELRPADILTQAAHPSLTSAVDVMVKSPNATGAGLDCTEAGKREKLERYAAVLPELEAQGIRYAPAVFSAYGRRHPDVTHMLNQAARRVARRRGVAIAEVPVRGWARDLAVAVWSRAAAMVHRCLGDGAELAAAAAPAEEGFDDGEDDEDDGAPVAGEAVPPLWQ